MTRTLTLDEAAEMLKKTSETLSDCIHHRGLSGFLAELEKRQRQ